VSNKLPSREQAIQLLIKNGCSPRIISHCQAVAKLAAEIAMKIQSRGIEVDLKLVEVGALLHDIGRSKTHSVNHGIAGAQIAQSAGMPESVVRIIKRHVGGGFTPEEAERFGWPKDVYAPTTLEEKIVSYSDKRIEQLKTVPIEVEIQKLQAEGHGEAAERVRKLHEEISKLLGD